MSDTVEDVVSNVVKWFQKKRAPGERDDLFQEGMRIAFSTKAKYPDRAGNPGYLYGAVRKELGNYVSKNLAACTIRSNWGMARSLRGTVQVDDLQVADAAPLPEEQAVDEQVSRHMQRWRIDFRRALDRVMRSMSDEQRLMIEKLHGFDGSTPVDPTDLAREMDLPVRVIYQVGDKFKRRVRGDIEFYLLNERLAR